MNAIGSRIPCCLLRFVLMVMITAFAGCAGISESDLAATGSHMSGKSDAYTLHFPNDQWLVVPNDMIGEEPVDFHLVRKGGTGWITAAGRQGVSLESIVPNRRAVLLANGATNYQERRYFLGERDQITTSLARYVVRGDVVLVLTAIQAPFAVEIVARTRRAGGWEREIIQILESIHFGKAGDVQ